MTTNRVFRVTTKYPDKQSTRILPLGRVVQCVSAGVVAQAMIEKLYLAGIFCDNDLADFIGDNVKVESWSPLDYYKDVDQDFNPAEWGDS